MMTYANDMIYFWALKKESQEIRIKFFRSEWISERLSSNFFFKFWWILLFFDAKSNFNPLWNIKVLKVFFLWLLFFPSFSVSKKYLPDLHTHLMPNLWFVLHSSLFFLDIKFLLIFILLRTREYVQGKPPNRNLTFLIVLTVWKHILIINIFIEWALRKGIIYSGWKSN